jgi:hypothetical protein
MAYKEQQDARGRESIVAASRRGSGVTGEHNGTEMWAVSELSKEENECGRFKVSTLARTFTNDRRPEIPRVPWLEFAPEFCLSCKSSATDEPYLLCKQMAKSHKIRRQKNA